MKNGIIGFAVFSLVCILRIYSPSNVYQPLEDTPAAEYSDESSFGTPPTYDGYPEPEKEMRAYVSLITGCDADPADPEGENDVYLKGAMMLAYQLLHAPTTQTIESIPFIMMVTKDVTQQRRDRLATMGAIIHEVDFILPEDHWMLTSGAIEHRFRKMFVKLRAWELLHDYSRALFMDTDMILRHRLDDVFNDPNATLQASFPDLKASGEENPPPSYILSGVPETSGTHLSPPSLENGGFSNPEGLNGGFFLFAPNKDTFTYYVSLLNEPGRFDPKYAEQSMLNYVHRRGGPMPWQKLEDHVNVRFPNRHDYKDDVVHSFHDKWWAPEGFGAGTLQPYYEQVRSETEGFYQAALEERKRQGYR